MEPVAFGKFVLVERLAHGGMAEVFRAVMRGAAGVEKTIALKRILPGLDGASEFIDMFIDEARIASSLTHVNVAQVFEFGEVGGSYYLAMELIDGVDLGRLITTTRRAGARVPAPIAAFLVAEAARGLAYAHDKRGPNGTLLGIVHRDVSPQNVLVSYAGEVKIADFGIAKAIGKLHKTASGAVMGKLRYMSPEQISGEPLDGRSDVFSLGAVLYELVTGGPLFDGDNPGQVTDQVRRAEVAAPSTRAADVPAELDRICLKALARARDARYGRAAELARELSAFVAEQAAGLTREDVGAYVAGLVPRADVEAAPVEGAATTVEQPVAAAPLPAALAPQPTRLGRTPRLAAPTPSSWPVALLATAGLLGLGGLAWRYRVVAPPPLSSVDGGAAPSPAAAPPVMAPAGLGAADKERLLAALEMLPQAEAAWRGVPAEDYLAVLSAVDAAVCAGAAAPLPSPARATIEPSFPSDVLDRLERRHVGAEARATARYLLATGELPERVALALRAFLRGRPAFSPGAAGWSAATLAVLVEPDEPRHRLELVRQQGALRRWRDTPATAAAPLRFAELCDRRQAVTQLAVRRPGPPAEALQRYLRAAPAESPVDDGGLRWAVIAAERDEGAATLEVRLRLTNPGADERPLALETLRLADLDSAPTVEPPAPRLGSGLVREVRLKFAGVTDAVAEAAVLVLRPGLELQAYSEDLR